MRQSRHNGQNTSKDSTSSDKIVLRMAWWGSQTRHDATNKVIEMYEAEFYDFNSYIESGIIDVSDTTESFLNTTKNNDGKQAGISIGTNTYGIAYAPAMFEESGVAEPTDDWTWVASNQINAKVEIEDQDKLLIEKVQYGEVNPDNPMLTSDKNKSDAL